MLPTDLDAMCARSVDGGEGIAVARSMEKYRSDEIERAAEEKIKANLLETHGLVAGTVAEDGKCYIASTLMVVKGSGAEEPSSQDKDATRGEYCDIMFGPLYPGKVQSAKEIEARDVHQMMDEEVLFAAAKLYGVNFKVRSL